MVTKNMRAPLLIHTMRAVRILASSKKQDNVVKKTIVKLAFVLSTLLAGCSNQTEKKHSTNEIRVDTMKVFLLKKGRAEKQITLPGELLPFERVEIRPKVTGYIKQLKVDIGSIVKKGQML